MVVSGELFITNVVLMIQTANLNSKTPIFLSITSLKFKVALFIGTIMSLNSARQLSLLEIGQDGTVIVFHLIPNS